MDNDSSIAPSVYLDHNYYYYTGNYYHVLYATSINCIEMWFNRVVPAISCFVGIPANLYIMIAFTFHNCGISRSARFYNVTIAVVDVVNVVSFHLFEYVGFILRPTWNSVTLPLNNNFFCKAVRWLWYAAFQTSGIIVDIFCIERLNAISNPISARYSRFSRNTIIASLLVIILALPTTAYLINSTNIVPFQNPPYTVCVTSSIDTLGILTSYSLIWQELIPVIVELFCNVLLLWRVLKITRWRSMTLDNSDNRGLWRKEARASLALIIVSFIRSSVYIPDGLFWMVSVSATEAGTSIAFFNLGMITTLSSGLLSTFNIFV